MSRYREGQTVKIQSLNTQATIHKVSRGAGQSRYLIHYTEHDLPARAWVDEDDIEEAKGWERTKPFSPEVKSENPPAGLVGLPINDRMGAYNEARKAMMSVEKTDEQILAELEAEQEAAKADANR